MKKLIYFLLLSPIFFIGCSNQKKNPDELEKVKLIITNNQSEVIDNTLISVIVENNTDKEQSILKGKKVYVTDSYRSNWRLVVLLEDSILFISPIHLYNKTRRKTYHDYICIESGGKYEFTYLLDFKQLATSRKQLGELNKQLGEYSIYMIYTDKNKVGKVKNKIRYSLKSNVIKVIYKEE